MGLKPAGIDARLSCSYSKLCRSISTLKRMHLISASMVSPWRLLLSLTGMLLCSALVWVDDRTDYGEARMIALAPKTAILYFVAYVDRSTVRRIISLRKANRWEAKHYVKATEEKLRGDPNA